MQELAQGRTSHKWLSWNLNPGDMALQLMLLNITLFCLQRKGLVFFLVLPYHTYSPFPSPHSPNSVILQFSLINIQYLHMGRSLASQPADAEPGEPFLLIH